MSASEKHTPGPWKDDEMACYVFAGNMMVCQIRGWGHLTGRGALNLPEDKAIEIQKANGRLIAAAPDLLEACKEWVEIDGPTVSLQEQRKRWAGVVAKMKAAIAKAEGA